MNGYIQQLHEPSHAVVLLTRRIAMGRAAQDANRCGALIPR